MTCTKNLSRYPPKLVAIREAGFGSILVLDDGSEVPIDVAPARLSRAMFEYDGSQLHDLVGGRSLPIWVGPFSTTADEWQYICNRVRASAPAIAELGKHPSLWQAFSEEYAVVRSKPHRVYGGLNLRLYTSHPFEFQEDLNCGAKWHRALLKAPGGWLLEMWVHMDDGQVKVRAARLPGHFVE